MAQVSADILQKTPIKEVAGRFKGMSTRVDKPECD